MIFTVTMKDDWAPATDNHGQPYMGCRNCRIKTLKELGLEPGTSPPSRDSKGEKAE